MRGGAHAVTPDDPFNALRERAYELASSGRFKRWDQIAYKLRGEGFLSNLITRLDGDRLAVMMITRCCSQARA
jgi:hypothetical protein